MQYLTPTTRINRYVQLLQPENYLYQLKTDPLSRVTLIAKKTSSLDLSPSSIHLFETCKE
jgi:hypothetical protein